MRKELDRIIENLDTVFRGDAWHGPSVMEMLQSLPPHVVDQSHPTSKNTIAQLVFHLKAWRVFAKQKLAHQIHYHLDTPEANWGTPEETAKESWPNLVDSLKKAHQELIDALEEHDDMLLSQRVPGEHYDFYTLLTGIPQHDTYHLGMIWVLWN